MNNKIKIEYDIKIKNLKRYNEYYYDKNKPLVSDAEYDDLKNQIFELEKKYKILKSKYSPSVSVGHKPSKNFKKVPHRKPMLSLSNAFSLEDLQNFEKKNIKLFEQG